MPKISELRALLAKATPGPWQPCPVTDDLGITSVQMIQSYTNEPLENAMLYAPQDAALIVAMRNSYEALLDVAEAAEEHSCNGWNCSICAALAKMTIPNGTTRSPK